MSATFYSDKKSTLSGETIVMLALSRYDSLLQSTSYSIAQELAKTNRVFYVDNPFTIYDWLKRRKTADFKRRKPLFSYFSNGLIATGNPSLQVIISPVILSVHFLPEGKLYRQLLKVNEWIIQKRIKKVLAKEAVTNFIYINSANFHFPDLIDNFKPALKVYHCVDPVCTGFDKRHGLVSESKLLKKTDLAICTSKQLQLEKKQENSNSFFVANATDFSHIGKALEDNLAVHPVLNDIKKPVIGYIGSIERRIDYVLLEEVVKKNPDKSFVFAGPVIPVCVPEWFYHQPNLHLTGPLPYQDLPALIKGFDVALIPFKRDEVSRKIFPLKLFEYLGAGKPVVSLNFNPDLKDFTKGTVVFCDHAAGFSTAIEQELSGNSPQKIKERVAVAAENTWVKRAQDISELLAAEINKR